MSGDEPAAGGGFSNHSSEREVLPTPNIRMLVQRGQKSPPGCDADGFGHGPQYVVEALILPACGRMPGP